MTSLANDKLNNRLTQKQEAFCLKYFELGNATQAALVAGYSPKTARFLAAENLAKPNIQTRMAELRKPVEDATRATVAEIDRTLTSILRTTPADVLKVSDDGRDLTIDKEALKSPGVSSIRTEQSSFNKMPVRITRVSIADKIRAADQLCKMKGVYSAIPQVNQDNRVVNIFVVDKETKALLTRVREGERTGKLIEG